ncbi:MAG: ABC transporter permease [Pirellulales bacterium]|nr:ABC transporter permease [Pirellulales bacterium]
MKMSLGTIAFRSIKQRSLASGLTVLSMALGVMLVVAVLLIYGVVDHSFRSNSSLGYNMIVGAKGGKLQLVLNTVYHLSSPVENIPYSYYQEFLPQEKRGDGRYGKYSNFVKFAIPLCLGDYYEDYRVVATTPEMFDDFMYDLDYERKYEFAEGRNFKLRSKEHGFFEGVLGATVARKLGLKPGDTVAPSCGAVEGKIHAPFTIVGVLKPTGTPNDRAIFVNIEGFFLLDGHAKPIETEDAYEIEGEGGREDTVPTALTVEDDVSVEPSQESASTQDKAQVQSEERIHPHDRTEPLPIEQREVTAVLVRTASPFVVPGLKNNINEGVEAQAVMPIEEITGLFDTIVRQIQIVQLVTFSLICVVSGVSILVSIYNSMSERRREIAVMRALGADRGTVMLIVLVESILLALGGGLLGWTAGHLLVGAASPWIEANTGVSIGIFDFAPSEVLLIPSLIILAVLVGFLPARSAYKTDVGDALSSSP